MTCIVGLVAKERVWIGADSAGVAGLHLVVRRDQKVFEVGEFLIGFTSSFRMGQLLQFNLSPPLVPENIDLYEYMVVHFVEKVRQTLKSGGFAKVEDSVESGGCFLVGFRGRLFKIDEDFQVGESRHAFDADGCGGSYALGALAATQEETDPKKRILTALGVAETFSAGVRGPFVVKSIGVGGD